MWFVLGFWFLFPVGGSDIIKTSKPTQTRLHRTRDLNKNLITRQKKLDLEASSSFVDVQGPVRNVGGGYPALCANFAVLAQASDTARPIILDCKSC